MCLVGSGWEIGGEILEDCFGGVFEALLLWFTGAHLVNFPWMDMEALLWEFLVGLFEACLDMGLLEA